MSAKFEFDMTEAVESARKAAFILIKSKLENSSERLATRLMSSGKDFYGPQEEGLAHEILRKKAEEFVLSPAFDKLADEMIAKVIPEEVEKAARTLVNSKARKKLFQPTSPVDDERTSV